MLSHGRDTVVVVHGSGGHGDGLEEDVMDVAVCETGRWGCLGRWVPAHPRGRRLLLLQSRVSFCDLEPVHH